MRHAARWDMANVRRLVDEAVDLGFVEVFFTGGEPFILNDIYDDAGLFVVQGARRPC